ncbi:hypothetical protein Tco_1424142, partial [Tanacetum coccineum]
LDEYAIKKKIIESKTTELNADTSKSKNSETVGNTNEVNVEKPTSINESVVSTPNINKDKVIIEDWNSVDENDVSEVSPVKTNETQTAKTQVDKIGQTSKKAGIGFKKIKACFVYDLIELYRLVIKKYGVNRPEEIYDRVLWGDLKTMFDPPLIHCLTLDDTTIYMLADRKYPLSKDACQVMLKMKLLDGTTDEVCYQLLKMIEKQAGLR